MSIAVGERGGHEPALKVESHDRSGCSDSDNESGLPISAECDSATVRSGCTDNDNEEVNDPGNAKETHSQNAGPGSRVVLSLRTYEPTGRSMAANNPENALMRRITANAPEPILVGLPDGCRSLGPIRVTAS